MARRRVGILVFPEVEVLDFCGPFEVFSAVRLDEARRRDEPSPYEVVLLAESTDVVTATGGLKVVPDRTLDDPGALDVLVLPGGWGVRRLLSDEPLLAWIKDAAGRVESLATVCTGSLLLGKTGFLDGKPATTHWRVLDEMRAMFPDVEVVEDRHVVEADGVVTSAGISAGIDMALWMVARHHGETVARATARHMEYAYPTDNRRRVETSRA